LWLILDGSTFRRFWSIMVSNSGAAHHMTNNANNFSNKISYHGHDVVKLGNDSSIPITDIGSACFTRPQTNIVIHLRQLLHVPTITKNLISVSKFAKDNDVFFEFHANQYLVKFQATKQILLQGKLRDGLCFSSFSSAYHLFCLHC